MMTDLWLRTTPRAMAGPPLSPRPRQLHRQLPGYAITPLVSAPALAEACGIASLHLKLEDCRLGLPAFKILGASWAVVAELERLLRAAAGAAGPCGRPLPLRSSAARGARTAVTSCAAQAPDGWMDRVLSDGALVDGALVVCRFFLFSFGLFFD